jgi:hypothetical protein
MQKGVATNPMVVGATKNMVVRGLKSAYVNVRLSVCRSPELGPFEKYSHLS